MSDYPLITNEEARLLAIEQLLHTAIKLARSDSHDNSPRWEQLLYDLSNCLTSTEILLDLIAPFRPGA